MFLGFHLILGHGTVALVGRRGTRSSRRRRCRARGLQEVDLVQLLQEILVELILVVSDCLVRLLDGW